MQIQKKIFRSYHQVHGKFLEQRTEDRQQWFDNICKLNYEKHLKNGKILEIGCNKGYILKWLNEQKFKYIEGIDLSPEDVEFAKKYTGLKNIFRADAFDYLRNKKGSYDCIISKDVLEHIEKDRLDEFILLIKQALKPEGKVIIQVPNMDWLMAGHERYMDLTHEVGFTRESLGELLRLHFEEAYIFPVKYDVPTSIRSKISHYCLRPIALKLTRTILTIVGGAGSCWFEYREILAVARK